MVHLTFEYKKWNFYCSYLHTYLYSVQQQKKNTTKKKIQHVSLQLSFSVLKKDVNMDLDVSLFLLWDTAHHSMTYNQAV